MNDWLKENGLAIVILIIALLAFALFFRWLFESDPKIIAAFLALGGILLQQWYNKKREIAEAHRAKKAELYSNFIELVRGFVSGKIDPPENRGKPIDDELKDKINELSDGMIIWASPGVIKAWVNYKDMSNEATDEKLDMIKTMDVLLREMRKDLGNSNFGLEVGDIVKLYYNPKSN